MKRPDVVVNGESERSNHNNGREECDRSQKHSYPARLGELLFVKWPQAGVRDDYRKTAKDQRQQDWQSP